MSAQTRWNVVSLALLIAAEATTTSARADVPSAEYRAVLRRTFERRKARRDIRITTAVGKIVPFPLPPSLIIRHTREVHGEVEGLLDLLRR